MARVEKYTLFAVALAIPLYFGLFHLRLLQLVVYCGVASAAVTTGEYVEAPSRRADGLRIFVAEWLLWFLLITIGGGGAYLLARIL